MKIEYCSYHKRDLSRLKEIWDEVVSSGNAFPQDQVDSEDRFAEMLQEQSAVTCILADGQIAGFYILHPNGVGRLSHTANASYAIAQAFRGKKLGRPLVQKSLDQARELGFRGMQYNAVVVENNAAIHIYLKLGFEIIGTVPGGYRMPDNSYSDMYIMYFPVDSK